MIYLDYAATTPISQKALQVYNQVAQDYFANASSLHDLGTEANELLQACREQLARFINGEERGIYFTSGGSESNYLALRSLAKANRHKGKHIITTSVEHPSLLNSCKTLVEEGYELSILPVNQYGQVELRDLIATIRKDTILVSICHANSETGTIQPLEQIGAFLKEQGIIFHSDCVQSFGKIPIDVKKYQLDSISISGHKVYGPKGVGAVYISPHVRWQAVIPGSSHERGFRPGTLNVPGIASFVAASDEVMATMEREAERALQLKEKLVQALKDIFPNLVVEGHPEERLPHHLGFRIPGMDGQYALLELNRLGIAISSGSACQVGLKQPSPTLLAMGRSQEEAYQFIRLTLGRPTTETEINQTIHAFRALAKQYFSV